MKKIFLIILFGLLCGISFGEIQKDLEEKSLGYLHLPNLEAFFTKIDGLYPPGSSPTPNLRLVFPALLFKTTKGESLNLSKDIFYFYLNPEKYSNPFFYSAHIQDKDLFLLGFGKGLLGGKGCMLVEETRNQPVQKYIEEKTLFDRDSYIEASKNGPADPVQFQKKTTIEVFVAFADDRIIVSGDPELVKQAIDEPLEKIFNESGIDLSISLKPFLLFQTYKEELKNLKQKFNFSSDPETFDLVFDAIESCFNQILEFQMKISLAQKNLEMLMMLSPVNSSSLENFIIKSSNAIATRPVRIPQESVGFLRIDLVSPNELLKIFQLPKNDPKEPLIENYLSQTEGLMDIFLFPSDKNIEILAENYLKPNGVQSSHQVFNQWFQQLHQAKITKVANSSIEAIQLPKSVIYSLFDQQVQWIGTKFDSSEEFKKDIEYAQKTTSPTQEFLTATKGFPKNPDLLFYYSKPGAGYLMSGYGKGEGKKMSIFIRADLKEWLDAFTPKQPSES